MINSYNKNLSLKKMYLTDLPEEIICHIFSYLPPRTDYFIVSTRINRIVTDVYNPFIYQPRSLHKAITLNNMDIFHHLLKDPRNKVPKNELLTLGCKYGHTRIVKHLLSYPEDYHNNSIALKWASFHGWDEIIDLLINQGKILPNNECLSLLINNYVKDKEDPIYYNPQCSKNIQRSFFLIIPHCHLQESEMYNYFEICLEYQLWDLFLWLLPYVEEFPLLHEELLNNREASDFLIKYYIAPRTIPDRFLNLYEIRDFQEISRLIYELYDNPPDYHLED